MAEQEGPIEVTTSEVLERRHLVKPYQDRPVVELAPGVVGCPFCGNGEFRRSRLRFSDLLEVLLLRYAVRCTRCGVRQHVELAIALLAYPPKHASLRPAKGHETWQNWTAPTTTPVAAARPLSTALGPKARNLEPVIKSPRIDPPSRIRSRRDNDNSIW